MKADLQQKLYDAYPKLYHQRDLSMMETCMCWGIECGDGWYGIVNDLSRALEWLNNNTPTLVEAVQVKEKFGQLRFYTSITRCDDDFPDNIVWHLCDYAEVRSGHVCELCGKPGKLYSEGWYVTRCNECYEEDRRGDKIGDKIGDMRRANRRSRASTPERHEAPVPGTCDGGRPRDGDRPKGSHGLTRRERRKKAQAQRAAGMTGAAQHENKIGDMRRANEAEHTHP